MADRERLRIPRDHARMLERISLALEDSLEALERDGASYARAYALAMTTPPRKGSRGGSPARPVGMRLPVAKLIRELVLEELHVGTKG